MISKIIRTIIVLPIILPLWPVFITVGLFSLIVSIIIYGFSGKFNIEFAKENFMVADNILRKIWK